jgi:hypothetical protein
MIDLVIYNDRTAFAPSVIHSGSVQVGGFEVACEQIARGIAKAGREVLAFQPGHARVEAGVVYVGSDAAKEERVPLECRALLTARACPIPDWIKAERTFTTCVDDPRGSWSVTFDHLKGRSTIVALSEWQAQLYRDLGHERVIVLPSMIEDDYAQYARCEKVPRRFVCVNAWNKGTAQTIGAWAHMRQRLKGCTLAVGSPYSHPPDAADWCAFNGIKWLGTLSPLGVVDALSTAEAVFRVCTAPETFGVADAIAEVVGTRVHGLFLHGMGASRDVLSSPWLTGDSRDFEAGVVSAIGSGPAVPRGDYRVSTVIKRWEEVLFG